MTSQSSAERSRPPEPPLFYGTVVPLDRERHHDLRLDTGVDRFAFAAKTNLIPAVVDEFVSASRRLPIMFMPSAKGPSAVFMTGLRTGENVFIDSKGRWKGYAPAYARRVPFVIGDVKDGDSIVCIDERSPLFDESGSALFAEGAETPLLQEAIRFMNEYLAAAKRTEMLITTLQNLDLLTAITIDVRRPDIERQTFHGLLVVDQAKLENLSDGDFLSLREARLLAPLYAHIASVANLEVLIESKPAKVKG